MDNQKRRTNPSAVVTSVCCQVGLLSRRSVGTSVCLLSRLSVCWHVCLLSCRSVVSLYVVPPNHFRPSPCRTTKPLPTIAMSDHQIPSDQSPRRITRNCRTTKPRATIEKSISQPIRKKKGNDLLNRQMTDSFKQMNRQMTDSMKQ